MRRSLQKLLKLCRGGKKTMEKKIRLSDHFTYARLVRFVLPSIVMMIFTSIYGVVDGLFVSNFVGKTPFAALNLVMPVIMILGAVGFMIGTGGSALIAKVYGEGEEEKAKSYFTLMVIFTVLLGIVFTFVGMAVLRPLCILLKATEDMIDSCVLYGRIVIGFITFFMLQNVFQSFFITAGKPQIGLFVTLAAGITNMALDALFVAGFKWGLAGAAVATGIGQCIGGIVPLIYFAGPNRSSLRFTKPIWRIKPLLQACANGSSELMSNISSSLVSMLYNYQLMRFIGEDGVSAYGVLMYVQLIFLAISIGYSIGMSPIVSYHLGAKNDREVKNIYRKSLILIGSTGIVLTVLAQLLAIPLAKGFVGYDDDLCALTVHAFRLFSFMFLLAGLNIFASAFFTALNNGAVSAIISFMRTLVFQTASVWILPMILGTDGIWWAISIAEALAFVVSLIFLIANRKKYRYA